MAENQNDWTFADAINKSENFIKDHKLPVPRRPEGFGSEYDFPTDPRVLTGIELSQIMLRMAAYRGYCHLLLGQQDVELSSFQSVYDIMLGKAMNDKAAASSRKLVKEVLRAVTISDDDQLRRLTRSLTEREAVVKRLEHQLKIYEDHLFALSREQSRRESEARAVRG